ncbi:TRAP transporter large permease [Litorimonas sp.]|jgi:tripartite ATP-independent transporter DctM subunit|uniref:TRAP transporter large permease n=1 Tax=Litorimonas sp. TaxID=1892381 RepID=UPI003A8BBD57
MLLSILVLLGLFFLLVMLGVPIAVSIALASVSTLMLTMPFDPAVTTMAQRLAGGLDSFTLLAIPFFVISGYLMGRGGIAKRLIEAAKAIVGTLPGGLALVNTLSCMLFGSISGSAVAATSAIGTFMIPTMEKEGYDKNFSTAVTVTGSILGLLIPPSNVLIVYAVAAGSVSIAALFMAGYLPGILAGLALMVVAAGYAKRENYPRAARLPMRVAAKKLFEAGPSILMILIVVGGIIAGIFTATEASAIAVIYSLALSLFYREIKLKDLPDIFLKSIETTAMVLLLIGVSTGMAWVLAYENIPQAISDALLMISDNPIIILLLINIILLVVGAFLDITPAILIFTPIFLPVAVELGMSPLHFGIMLVLNLSIGLCTPPVGSVLFVGCAVAGTTIQRLIKPLVMLYAALIVALLLVTYVPFLSEGLPRAFGLIQ